MSDFFYSLLSDFGKSYCREVDRVTVKGSVNPMMLYTIDVDETLLKRDDELADPDGQGKGGDALLKNLSKLGKQSSKKKIKK